MEEKKSFQCDKCTKSFDRKGNLNMHFKYIHGKVGVVKCKLSDYLALTASMLRSHIRITHLIVKRFTCDKCEYATAYNFTLTQHKRSMHIDVNQYYLLKCMECDKGFANRENLVTHVKGVHKKIQPYKCNVCSDKSFSRSSHLETCSNSAPEYSAIQV